MRPQCCTGCKYASLPSNRVLTRLFDADEVTLLTPARLLHHGSIERLDGLERCTWSESGVVPPPAGEWSLVKTADSPLTFHVWAFSGELAGDELVADQDTLEPICKRQFVQPLFDPLGGQVGVCQCAPVPLRFTDLEALAWEPSLSLPRMDDPD